jgi:hypothetical protein
MPDALRGDEDEDPARLPLVPFPLLRPVEVLRGDEPEVFLKFSR